LLEVKLLLLKVYNMTCCLLIMISMLILLVPNIHCQYHHSSFGMISS